MSNKPVLAEDILKEIGLHHFVDVQDLSDGRHSFADLYEHRSVLFLCLISSLFEPGFNPKYKIRKSKLHFDGTSFEGYFIVMVTNVALGEQISYHLETKKYWDLCDFQEVEFAPEWDGHTSDDVVTRLISWFL